MNQNPETLNTKQVIEIPYVARLEIENAHMRVMLLEMQIQAAQRERQRMAHQIAQSLGFDLGAYEIDITRGVAVRVVPPSEAERSSGGTPERSAP